MKKVYLILLLFAAILIFIISALSNIAFNDYEKRQPASEPADKIISVTNVNTTRYFMISVMCSINHGNQRTFDNYGSYGPHFQSQEEITETVKCKYPDAFDIVIMAICELSEADFNIFFKNRKEIICGYEIGGENKMTPAKKLPESNNWKRYIKPMKMNHGRDTILYFPSNTRPDPHFLLYQQKYTPRLSRTDSFIYRSMYNSKINQHFSISYDSLESGHFRYIPEGSVTPN